MHREPSDLTLASRHWMVYQLLSGMKEIHDRDCYHGNLNAEAIFVTESDWIIISDPNPVSLQSGGNGIHVQTTHEGQKDDVYSIGYSSA